MNPVCFFCTQEIGPGQPSIASSDLRSPGAKSLPPLIEIATLLTIPSLATFAHSDALVDRSAQPQSDGLSISRT